LVARATGFAVQVLPPTIDGAMTGKKFLAYVEKCLVVRFN
jgi:hypothetical protein